MALIRMTFSGDTPDRVAERLKAVSKIPKDKTEQVKILAPAASILKGAIQRNIETTLDEGARTGKWPATGTLRDSVMVRFITKDAAVEVGPEGVIYAIVHEEGKTIHAKNVPYMIFYIEYEGGRRVKFRRKTVTIPPRPYVRPALVEGEAALLGAIGVAFSERIRIAINRASG